MLLLGLLTALEFIDIRVLALLSLMQGVLDGAERFDAGFFGFTPKEAQELHPSHRLFFECAVEALEHAGLDPDRYGEGIGVFAGMESYATGDNTTGSTAEGLQHAIHTGVDYLTTHLSYLLDLRGQYTSAAAEVMQTSSTGMDFRPQ